MSTARKPTNRTPAFAEPHGSGQEPPAIAAAPVAASAGQSALVRSGPEHHAESAAIEAAPAPTAQNAAQNPKKPERNRGGAPVGNVHAMKGGERRKLAFRAAARGVKGEGSMIAVVNKWRRTLEAELIAKYGTISSYQDARIIAACHWDLCRKRRNELARAATTNAERLLHDEQAAADCERRDHALQQAGLATPNGKATNGRHFVGDIELPASAFEDDQDAAESVSTQQAAASEPETVSTEED
jgi:hypothetical protein